MKRVSTRRENREISRNFRIAATSQHSEFARSSSTIVFPFFLVPSFFLFSFLFLSLYRFAFRPIKLTARHYSAGVSNIRLVEKSLLFNFANFALFASLSDKYYNYKHSQSARTPSRRSTIKFTSRASISRNVKKRCKNFHFSLRVLKSRYRANEFLSISAFYCSIVGQAREKKKFSLFFPFLPYTRTPGDGIAASIIPLVNVHFGND